MKVLFSDNNGPSVVGFIELFLINLCFQTVLYTINITILSMASAMTTISSTRVIMLFLDGLFCTQFLIKLPMSANMITTHGVNKYNRNRCQKKFSNIEYATASTNMLMSAMVAPMLFLAPAS